MHGVFADGERELFADGAFCGVGRVGGAHDFAVFRDGVFTFENLHNDRLGDHEFAQFAKERTVFVDAVEFLRLSQRQLDALACYDAQAGLFEFGNDLAGQVALGCVGFDDGEGTLDRHGTEPLGWVKWNEQGNTPRPKDCAPDSMGRTL